MRIILALSLISSISFGADIQTMYLPSGTPAPFSGFLFTQSDANQAAQNKQAVATYKLINESLTTSLNLETKSRQDSDAKVVILQNDLANTNKALSEVKSATMWEKVMWFGFGVLATGLAVDGAYKLSQIH